VARCRGAFTSRRGPGEGLVRSGWKPNVKRLSSALICSLHGLGGSHFNLTDSNGTVPPQLASLGSGSSGSSNLLAAARLAKLNSQPFPALPALEGRIQAPLMCTGT
jgi:hypothetical protein